MKGFAHLTSILVCLALISCGKSSDIEAELEQGPASSCAASPSKLNVSYGATSSTVFTLKEELASTVPAQFFFVWDYPANWSGLRFANDSHPLLFNTTATDASKNKVKFDFVLTVNEMELANQELRALQSPHPIRIVLVLMGKRGPIYCEVPASAHP